jgi:phosphoribosylformylglycinamidine cyclo-ligase
MRLDDPFVYRVDFVPPPPPVFETITRAAGLDAKEAYGTFNMGVGFAVYVRPEDAKRALELARAAGFTAWRGGTVTKDGARKAVEIPPLGLAWSGDELKIRED